MLRVLALLSILLFTLPIQADQTKVDVELVFIVDVSFSMSDSDIIAGRETFRHCFLSDRVINQIQSNFNQTIAVTYIEFADYSSVMIPTSLISTKQDAINFISKFPENRTMYGATMIGNAIDLALNILYKYDSKRRVIILIGDGFPSDSPLFRKVIAEITDPHLLIYGLYIIPNSNYATHVIDFF